MDLNQLVRKLEQKKSALVAFRDSRWPKRVGEMAISHFKRNFREGGWCDNGSVQKWKQTRRQEQGGKAAYYNRTPLLSGSNNLYGGFTYKAGAGKVIVSNEVKYAPIHNNGGGHPPDHPTHETLCLAPFLRSRRNQKRRFAQSAQTQRVCREPGRLDVEKARPDPQTDFTGTYPATQVHGAQQRVATKDKRIH